MKSSTKLSVLNMEYNAIKYGLNIKREKLPTFKQRLNLRINRAVKSNQIKFY